MIDQAIYDLWRRAFKMPEGLTPAQFRRGVRRLWVLNLVFVVGLALPASAATDLGDGACVQEDGQTGVWAVGDASDESCITPAEYEEMFSAENLLAVGVISGYQVNDDGTTTLHYEEGVSSVVATNPLDRKVAANPELEPDAPSVGELLFGHSRAYPV